MTGYQGSPRQRDQLLALLRSRAHAWVSLEDITTVAGFQYNARVYELRRLGHRIENKPGWFRLATAGAIDDSQAITKTPGAAEGDRLFPDLLPEDVEPRHLDLG